MTADGPPSGPVLISYDGTALARLAITRSGELLADRDALVVCIWQPYDVGFTPADGAPFDAKAPQEVRGAAERTAAAGAELARAAGFTSAGSVAMESSPIWKGIVDTADAHDAAVIVLGSRGHAGLVGRFTGSVARAVAEHCQRTALIVHGRV
jgi:nucleotide-binding universal stress UspA family protein